MGKKHKQNGNKNGAGGASTLASTTVAQVAQTPSSPVKKAVRGSPQKKSMTDKDRANQEEKAAVESPVSPTMQQNADKVEHALKRRKSIEEVQAAGIIKSPEDAEKIAQVTESMQAMMDARPDPEEMHKTNEHILNPTGLSRRLSGALASTAKDLEMKITAGKVDRQLGARPEMEELEKMNVLHSHGVAPQLQGVQMKLQRKMSSDNLSHRLGHRVDLQDLKEHNIVKDGVAPSLQATQNKLQRQINTDRVHQQLEKRPSLSDLSAHGVLDKTDTQVAASLTATAKTLERSMVQNHVSHLLETRPDKDALVTQHVFEDPSTAVSPALQASKHDLERHFKADQLTRQLRKRPSVTDLEEKGIIDEGELGDDFSNMSPKSALSRRARYTLALKAVNRISADNLITEDEKARLKDLILTDSEKVVAAIECYELDQDIEELLDTLYRVAKHG